MTQNKVQGTGTKQRRITGRSYSRTSSSTALIAFLLTGLSSIKVISSCVISPSESVAIVGDLSSFTCNARPSNQQEGSISFIKLGSDGISGTYIFRPPAYNRGGQIIKKQYHAEGYFIPHLDDSHSIVTIQINETQLKHGGQYFCICVDSTSTLGTANFTVLDKLSFGRSVDKVLTPGTMVDLNCSVSFNGSTSSAFIDLTISDANGTQVSTKRNLSLTKNVTGHHLIHYKVVADPKEEQRFTCEVKVWNKSSTGESLLRSMTSNSELSMENPTSEKPKVWNKSFTEVRPLHSLTSHFSLNWDHIQVTTPAPNSMSTAPQKAGLGAFIAVGVTATLLLVAVFVVVVFICMKCRTRSITNGTVIAHSVGQKSPTANQDIRYRLQ